MKKLLLYAAITLSLLCGGCQNTKQVSAALPVETGKLVNLTGLSGCGWLIELKDRGDSIKRRFEPINLSDFKLELKEGLEVEFTYVKQPTRISICMAGEMIELRSIEAKKK